MNIEVIRINILESFSLIIQSNTIIAPLIAFISGIIVAFLPCSLSSLPLLIVYLSGEDKNKAVKNSFMYAIGSIIMFMTLGLIVSFLGQRINFFSKWTYLILGFILMFLVLIMCGIIKIPNINFVSKIKKFKKNNNVFLGIILGIISQVFASPCSTPVIIAILSLVATSKNIIFSIIILLFYGLRKFNCYYNFW